MCVPGPTTPSWSKPARFGLLPFRSPLLWESRLISFRRATEMFQFAHGPRAILYIQMAVSRHHSGRVAPFGFSRLIARMQLPLNVSPVSASFFGLAHRGIHLVLSLACGCSCVFTQRSPRDVVLTLLCLCFFCSLLSAKLKKSFFTRLFFCSLVQGTTLSRGLLPQQLE